MFYTFLRLNLGIKIESANVVDTPWRKKGKSLMQMEEYKSQKLCQTYTGMVSKEAVVCSGSKSLIKHTVQ